ncbi:MAG: transposase [Candidatus Hydrogenedentes bacterium]|nr:transposase [Candidatus Hydrogenedentota bacterium]
MGLTMQERRVVTKALAEQFRRAGKRDKGRMLDDFVKATGYNRSYAAGLLRNHGRRVQVKPGVAVEGSVHVVRLPKARKRTYGADVAAALKKIWEILDYIGSKRLVAALPEVVPRLVEFRELKLSKRVQRQLLEISPATVDRLLQPERQRHAIKGRCHTKPGTLLKHQIPIRTFSDWDDAKPGFVEMDLVGHDGGVAAGDYCFTLDMTDVATGWSEQYAALNKAQTHVFEGIQRLRERFPFPFLGVDSDNGSEFINRQLFDYCQSEDLAFTRSRPYRKNDTCYVEQKNWSIVRRFAGYARYQGERARNLLNELYAALSAYVNFFMPSVKLVEKTRDGAKVTRRYGKPKTPYQRVLESNDASHSTKQRLRVRYKKLNPAHLKRTIESLQRKLLKEATRLTAAQTQALAAHAPGPNHPWRSHAPARTA